MNCIKCRGACCEEMVITSSVLGADFPKVIEEFLTARGRKVGSNLFVVETRCPQLTSEGLCGCHDTKPLACAMEPVGGEACFEAVKRRRTPEQYASIRDDEDPLPEELYREV